MKTIVCKVCGKQLANKTSLKTHRKVHEANGGKDFECSVCNRMFRAKTIRDRHQKSVHEGAKDFKCLICSKLFSRKEHVATHISTVHHGEKKFKCSKCEKTYTEKQALTKHQKSNPNCEESFSKRRLLKKHNKKVHGKLARSRTTKLVTDHALNEHIKSHENAQSTSAQILTEPREERPVRNCRTRSKVRDFDECFLENETVTSEIDSTSNFDKQITEIDDSAGEDVLKLEIEDEEDVEIVLAKLLAGPSPSSNTDSPNLLDADLEI